jgi:hypothetical protein
VRIPSLCLVEETGARGMAPQAGGSVGYRLLEAGEERRVSVGRTQILEGLAFCCSLFRG